MPEDQLDPRIMSQKALLDSQRNIDATDCYSETCRKYLLIKAGSAALSGDIPPPLLHLGHPTSHPPARWGIAILSTAVLILTT